MTLEILTAFFGWLAVLNIGILAAAAIGMLAMRKMAVGIHVRMFDLDETTVNAVYFRWLANYKLATLLFAVTPYLALRIM